MARGIYPEQQPLGNWHGNQSRQITARETLSVFMKHIRHGVGQVNSPLTIKAAGRSNKQTNTQTNKQTNKQTIFLFRK
jgi:hypothetical protein